jgi:hypothetical protein
MQVGDQINLAVVGEHPFTGVFAVAPGRVLLLPGLPEIALKGVLRSEVQDFMKEQLKKYIRDPQVRAQSLIRLSIFGGVTKPGYLQGARGIPGRARPSWRPAGPAGNADPNRTVVRRNGTIIVSNDAFQEAIVQGRTLDLLNLRAGRRNHRRRKEAESAARGVTDALSTRRRGVSRQPHFLVVSFAKHRPPNSMPPSDPHDQARPRGREPPPQGDPCGTESRGREADPPGLDRARGEPGHRDDGAHHHRFRCGW